MSFFVFVKYSLALLLLCYLGLCLFAWLLDKLLESKWFKGMWR